MNARPVVHVVPTAVARGAQVFARALADALDGPGTPHVLLCLFEGHDDIRVDEHLGCPGGESPGRGFHPRALWQLRARLGALDPVAVVAHGGDALKYVAPARLLERRARRFPCAYYAIGTMADPARRGARLLLWRALVARADVVAAVSDDVALECRDLLAVPSARLVVAPNGRDPALFRPADDPEAHAVPIVAFVGRLVASKRPERFVRLVGVLRDRGSALRAVLVGDGPMRDELEAPAAAAGVEMVGNVGNVAARLRAADVLVMPSLPAGEGMPGVLLEAGLSGLPVVATAVPGTSTVVEAGVTGEVVPVDDFEALVTATARLVDDPGRRRAMGAAARQRCAERFTMEASAATWQGVLDRLAPGPSVR